jgi:hypothetical protein
MSIFVPESFMCVCLYKLVCPNTRAEPARLYGSSCARCAQIRGWFISLRSDHAAAPVKYQPAVGLKPVVNLQLSRRQHFDAGRYSALVDWARIIYACSRSLLLLLVDV